MHVGHQGGGRRVGTIGGLPKQHLEQHYPEGVEVGPVVSVRAHGLLGGHVLRRTKGLARLREARAALQHPRQSEVRKDRPGVGIQQDVGRFQVSVHDPLAMGVVQGIRQGHHELQHRVRRQRPFAELVLEVAPRHQLADDEGEPLVVSKVIDLEDVGVTQPGNGLRLLGESSHEGRVLGVVGGEHLHRHVAVEGGVVGPEHGRHATAPKLLYDRVAPQAASGRD